MKSLEMMLMLPLLVSFLIGGFFIANSNLGMQLSQMTDGFGVPSYALAGLIFLAGFIISGLYLLALEMRLEANEEQDPPQD